jgi:hypothetical protein
MGTMGGVCSSGAHVGVAEDVRSQETLSMRSPAAFNGSTGTRLMRNEEMKLIQKSISTLNPARRQSWRTHFYQAFLNPPDQISTA